MKPKLAGVVYGGVESKAHVIFLATSNEMELAELWKRPRGDSFIFRNAQTSIELCGTCQLYMQNDNEHYQRRTPEEMTHRTVGILVGGLCLATVITMLWLRSAQTLGGF